MCAGRGTNMPGVPDRAGWGVGPGRRRGHGRSSVQKQVKALEAQRNTKRRALFDAQDDIDAQRERLIAEIEGKLQQRTSLEVLFAVRWRLV